MAAIFNSFASSRLLAFRLTSPSTIPLYLPPFYSNFKVSIRMDATPVAAGNAAVSKEDTVAVSDAASMAETVSESDPLIQYVVLRRDLIDTWPLGSVVSQGCHASVAAISTFKDDPFTVDYCSPTNLDFMRKVTVEVKGEAQMINLSEKLKSNGIDHKLWIEQPENIPTCIATKPYPKSIVSPFFKKLKLCK